MQHKSTACHNNKAHGTMCPILFFTLQSGQWRTLQMQQWPTIQMQQWRTLRIQQRRALLIQQWGIYSLLVEHPVVPHCYTD
jgi:hypothetical protein